MPRIDRLSTGATVIALTDFLLDSGSDVIRKGTIGTVMRQIGPLRLTDRICISFAGFPEPIWCNPDWIVKAPRGAGFTISASTPEDMRTMVLADLARRLQQAEAARLGALTDTATIVAEVEIVAYQQLIVFWQDARIEPKP